MTVSKITMALILSKAIETENNAIDFYRILEEKTESEDLKNIFRRLAAEEQTQMQDLKKMKDTDIIPDQEVKLDDILFLENLIDNFITRDAARAIEMAGISKSPEQVLEYAIDLEIKAVCLYMEIFQLTDNETVKNLAKELAEQEKEHLNKLCGLRISIWEATSR